MKIRCSKEDLSWGTQTVLRAISNKVSFPPLSSILIATGDNCFEFSGTDLEISINCRIPGEIIEQGSVLLTAKYFSEIVRYLPEGEISLEVYPENYLVHVNYSQAELKLNGLDPEQYPPLPTINDPNFYQVDPVLFKKMIRQVAFAVGYEDSRPVFNGVFVDCDSIGNITMVSTDTHRIAWCQGSLKNNPADQACSLIIPGRAMQELARIINLQEPLNISLQANQVAFVQDRIKLFSRIIEGQFLNYQQYLPKTWKTRIRAELRAFSQCVERAGVLTHDEVLRKPSFITFSIKEDLLVVSSHTEVGQIREELAVESEGEALDIAFNARYVLDALRVIDTPEIYFEFGGADTPAILRPSGDQSFFCLLLPVWLVQK